MLQSPIYHSTSRTPDDWDEGNQDANLASDLVPLLPQGTDSYRCSNPTCDVLLIDPQLNSC